MLSCVTLCQRHAVLAAFPLHTWAEKQMVEQRMLTLFMFPWKTPIVSTYLTTDNLQTTGSNAGRHALMQ